MKKLRALVTGTTSGLGASLRQWLDGTPFLRQDVDGEMNLHRKHHFDLIVHCATDARKECRAAELLPYARSHFTLTERLLEIPHSCFVFVSSHAVYPADGTPHTEDEELQVSSSLSLYGIFKLLGERLVLSRSAWPVILRCSSLVGETGRPNNIMRILRRQSGPVYLSGDSPYNLIAYEQVLEFIQLAWDRRLEGVFNLGASDWKPLYEIASHLGVNIEFGSHRYVPPMAELSKFQGVSPAFRKSTLEVARWVSAKLAQKN